MSNGTLTTSAHSHQITCGAAPSGTDPGSLLLKNFESFNAQSGNLYWSSIYESIAINVILGLVTVLLFSFLRPRNGSK